MAPRRSQRDRTVEGWAQLSERTRARLVRLAGGSEDAALEQWRFGGLPRGRRDYRAEYLRRAARRAEGETVRARLGHERAPVRAGRSASVMLDGPPRWELWSNLTRGEMRRATRYDALASNLIQGKVSPAAFRRRIGSWRPIRGERFLADPAAVLAILDARRAGDEETFRCSSGRAR